MNTPSKYQTISLTLLRISLGLLFFYSGITKVLNPAWSAEGYLKNAKTFSAFYLALTNSTILPYVNFLNKWGLLLIGISLILGIFVVVSSLSGAIIMLLYYFPVLDFPLAGEHSYIVDEHIIYLFALLVLAFFDAGKYWGLENLLTNTLSKFRK